MSLTAIQVPPLVSLVNNCMPIVYSSTNSGQSGFRYKVELLNSGGTTLNSVFVYPDATNSNKLIYDLSYIYKDYIDYDNNYNADDITDCPNSYFKYNYKITEYSFITSGSTISGSTYKYAIRGVSQYDETFDYNDYVCSASNTDGKFLSKWRSNLNRLGSFSGNYNSTHTPGNYATINALHTGGATEWVRVRYRIFGVSTSSNYYLYRNSAALITTIPLGVCNVNLAAIAGNLVNSAGVPTTREVIEPGTLYYEVTLEYEDSLYYTCSETIKVTPENKYYKFKGVEFIWLSELSTFESFIFTEMDVKSFNIKRNTYKKNQFRLIGTEYTYNQGDRGHTTKSLLINENHKVTSGWVDDDISYNLMDLFNSPEVYIVNNDVLYPVIITDSSIEEKNILNNKLFNYTISYTLAFEKNSNI